MLLSNQHGLHEQAAQASSTPGPPPPARTCPPTPPRTARRACPHVQGATRAGAPTRSSPPIPSLRRATPTPHARHAHPHAPASPPPHACATHPASLTGWLACSQPRPSGGWPVLKPVSNLSSPTCRLKPVVSNRLHPVYTTRWPTCLYNPLATPLFAPCASVLVLTSPRNLTRGRCRPSRGPGQHTQGRGQNTLSPPAEET